MRFECDIEIKHTLLHVSLLQLSFAIGLGASSLKESTSVGGNEKSGMGINAPKKPATKRKSTEEKDAPNHKTRSKFSAKSLLPSNIFCILDI